MATDPGWVPVLSLDGKTFCSPRCGYRCRRDEYEAAVASAAALAVRMGAGWEPWVWENGGWHYEVRKGVAEIHVTEDRRGERVGPSYPVSGYTAWINTAAKQFIVSAATPEDALGFATQEARTAISRIAADLDALFDGERSS
jgi:hypothetical protein